MHHKKLDDIVNQKVSEILNRLHVLQGGPSTYENMNTATKNDKVPTFDPE